MKNTLQKFIEYIRVLAQLNTVDIVEKLAAKPRDASYAVIDAAEIYLPLANLIDIQAEVQRLEKELTKLDAELERIKKKFTNKDFISKAPPEIIAVEKEKEQTYSGKRLILAQQLKVLSNQ